MMVGYITFILDAMIYIREIQTFVIKYTTTVNTEQWALIKHCLWMTKMVTTHSKIVEPLYILHEHMQF
jgi:hypothetical protein